MSHEITRQTAAAVANAEAAVAQAQQQSETFELVRLLMTHQTAQAEARAAETQALTAALIAAQQQNQKSGNGPWIVLGFLVGGGVLVALLLAVAVVAIAAVGAGAIAVPVIKQLKKGGK